jgi:hypothetical protein
MTKKLRKSRRRRRNRKSAGSWHGSYGGGGAPGGGNGDATSLPQRLAQWEQAERITRRNSTVVMDRADDKGGTGGGDGLKRAVLLAEGQEEGMVEMGTTDMGVTYAVDREEDEVCERNTHTHTHTHTHTQYTQIMPPALTKAVVSHSGA